MPEPRFRDITLTKEGFSGLQKQASNFGDFYRFSANFPLFIIAEAWYTGCSFEDLADGFGRGAGTNGDWSSIRDSSDASIQLMFTKALNHLFPQRVM